MARRKFIQAGAGATALVLGAGLGGALPAFAAPSSNPDPNPIPGGIPLGQIVGFPNDTKIYHVSAPAFGFEASSITDFTGFVAAAEVRGTGTGTDSSGANPVTLYFDADMRFMQGTYVGVDGKTHQNTFGFIWLDLFNGPLDQPNSVQIHDFNPGIATSGLFWTIPFPASQVSINLGNGTASMWATDWTIDDYTNIGNSIGDVPPIPVLSGTVSFTVNWTANGKPTQLPNKATPTDVGFAGLFINSNAQVWWSADEPAANFKFASDPAATSWTVSGVIGKEQNGRFYPPGG